MKTKAKEILYEEALFGNGNNGFPFQRKVNLGSLSDFYPNKAVCMTLVPCNII